MTYTENIPIHKNQDKFYLKIKKCMYITTKFNIGNFQSIDWMELYERHR